MFTEAPSEKKLCPFIMLKMVRSVTLFRDIEIEYVTSVSHKYVKPCLILFLMYLVIIFTL